jgi:hypothetical protein
MLRFEDFPSFLNFLAMQKEALRSFETSVAIYPRTEHDVTGHFSHQQRRCEKLRSPNVLIL